MMKRSSLLIASLLFCVPATVGADVQDAKKLNLAPPADTGSVDVNGLVNSTAMPEEATPNPRPSPVHLVVSCVDESGSVIQPGDVRYDHCVSEARSHGPMPIGNTGSTQAIGISIGVH